MDHGEFQDPSQGHPGSDRGFTPQPLGTPGGPQGPLGLLVVPRCPPWSHRYRLLTVGLVILMLVRYVCHFNWVEIKFVNRSVVRAVGWSGRRTAGRGWWGGQTVGRADSRQADRTVCRTVGHADGRRRVSRTVGRAKGWGCGRTDRWSGGRTVGRTVGRADGQAGGRSVGRANSRSDGRAGARLDGQLVGEGNSKDSRWPSNMIDGIGMA